MSLGSADFANATGPTSLGSRDVRRSHHSQGWSNLNLGMLVSTKVRTDQPLVQWSGPSLYY
jgi:hypothetical protein